MEARRVHNTLARRWYPSRSAFASGDFVPPACCALSSADATSGCEDRSAWKSTTRKRPRHPMPTTTVPAEKRVSAREARPVHRVGDAHLALVQDDGFHAVDLLDLREEPLPACTRRP